MKVYKFGGASVKDAAGIRNLGRIIRQEQSELIIVVSAFGKTTNILENVLKLWISGDKDYKRKVDEVYNSHLAVISELFQDTSVVRDKSDKLFFELKRFLSEGEHESYDADYDQVVSYGELWSTAIVAEYLNIYVKPVVWIDVRNVLRTDSRYRDANILWDESTSRAVSAFDFTRHNIYLTQGFIGGTDSGKTTTLGREGSDYTAAILANMLDAEKVVVWKDVPGLLNADPKWFEGAEKMEEVSYREAVEMTFSGAKVIHPKTIKPLHNKGIPLHVRSFIDTNDTGTIVKSDPAIKQVRPVYVRKEDQILISILPRDFSFVMGDNLGKIFNSFNENGIKVNLVEASAVSLDVCVDDERPKVEMFIAENKSHFTAIYNADVELLSIRHYTPEAISRITTGREILVEQRTRNSVRFVVRKIASLRSQ
ncbi:MAG TPA: aspartate kinase [Bacteroidales bacterium]|nr:aspartate kinase [Bacteroidales bacterium]